MNNVVMFPLGYKTGFWRDGKQAIPDAAHREFVRSFAGQVKGKPTRQEMVDHLIQFPNHYIHEAFVYSGINALNVNQYRDLLLNSVSRPAQEGGGKTLIPFGFMRLWRAVAYPS